MNTSDNFVYVLSKEHSWVPAKLLEQDKVKATVSIPQFSSEQEIVSGQSATSSGKAIVSFFKEVVELKNYPNKALPLQNVDETGEFTPVKDMVDVMFLHEVRRKRKEKRLERKDKENQVSWWYKCFRFRGEKLDTSFCIFLPFFLSLFLVFFFAMYA